MSSLGTECIQPITPLVSAVIPLDELLILSCWMIINCTKEKTTVAKFIVDVYIFIVLQLFKLLSYFIVLHRSKKGVTFCGGWGSYLMSQ